MRRILHLDMDAFFAAVEEIRNPALKGKPVVIGGDGNPAKRGVVSTASYAARKYGIHSAMPLRNAHRLCPQAVFLPVDYPEYSRNSKIIKGVMKGFSDVMEDVGIDEAFLDISGSPLQSADLAGQLKEKIRSLTGLTCSIGIAPNKLIAKVASDMQKPDGLTIVENEDIEKFLRPLPVRKLWGVGPKTEEALHGINIHTVGELAGQGLDFLTGRFGPSYGNYLHSAARGIDESQIVTDWEPRSISRETTFQQDTGKWQEIARTLAELTKEVVEDMRGRGWKTRTVTIKIRFTGFETFTRAKTLSFSTSIEQEIRRTAFECLGRLDLRRKVRLVGIRISNFEKEGSS